MKIFNLPEHKKNMKDNELGKFWDSFSSFNSHSLELACQDSDISKTKIHFDNYHMFRPITSGFEKNEKTKRMV